MVSCREMGCASTALRKADYGSIIIPLFPEKRKRSLARLARQEGLRAEGNHCGHEGARDGDAF